MEGKTITDEIVTKLTAPLSAEALYTKNDLTMIKPIYVIERLNEVFGIGGWQTQTCPIEKDGQNIVCKTTLAVPEYNIYHESYGSCANQDVGFAYKGAETDAINKISSFLGIGIDIYKGRVTKENAPLPKQNTVTCQNPIDYKQQYRYHFDIESHVNNNGNNYIVLKDIDQLENQQELLAFYHDFVYSCTDVKRKSMALDRLRKHAKALSIQVNFE